MGDSFILTDGTGVVSMQPDYDLRYESRKMESSHRTRSGANYRYTWGAYGRIKFNVDDLTSSDQCVINSWWGANSQLVLYDINSTVVISGYLTNAAQPIGSYMKPYMDRFKGTIELESY